MEILVMEVRGILEYIKDLLGEDFPFPFLIIIAQYEQPWRYTLLFYGFVGVGRKLCIRRTLDGLRYGSFLLFEEVIEKIHVITPLY